MSFSKHLYAVFLLSSLSIVELPAQDSISLLVDSAYRAQNPNESLRILRKINSTEDMVDTVLNRYYLSMGVAFGQLGKSDSSILFLSKCIDNARAVNDDYNLMRAYNSKGVLLRIQGQHDSSLEAFQNAEKITEKHGENERYGRHKSDVLGNIGGIFYQLKDYSSANRYSNRALEIAKHYNDTSELAYGYLRLAIVAQAQDSLDQSLDHNKQASMFLNTLGDNNTLAFVENNLGNIYKDKMDYEKALIHHKKSNEYAVMLGEEAIKAHTLLSIGESYYQLRNLTKSYENAMRGLRIAERGNFPIHTKNAHDLLYKIALAQRDFEKALEERNAYIIVNDSLYTAEAQERLAEVETKYETEKKEAEITRLSLQNDLQRANLTSSRNANIATGVGGGLTIVLLVVFFTLRHKKQQVEKEAQDLQIEALKKRFMEIHSSPSELAVSLDFEELNGKLNTKLTEREFEALKLSLEGKKNVEIADQLFISVSTVKFHLRNTYSKMGVDNRKEAFRAILETA